MPDPQRPRHRRKAAATAPATAPAAALILPAELGIDQARSLQAQLVDRLDQAEPVLLDGGEIQRIHTAAVQLFCLFCRDRRGGGRDVVWQRPSAALRSAAALLGVTTLLQLSGEPA